MDINVNYDRLKKILIAYADAIACSECPMYDTCMGCEQVYDCVEVYMNYIKGEEK